MSAIDLRFPSACEHAEPMGHDEADGEGGCLPVECQLCDWTGHVCDLLHCGDTEGDCTTNLWTPCCRTIDWCFV